MATQLPPDSPDANRALLDESRHGLRLLIAQIDSVLGVVEPNLEKHMAIIAEGERVGVDVVLFPELSLTGYFLRDLVADVALTAHSTILAELARASQEVDVVVGCILEEHYKLFNASIYFSRGRIEHIHRKVYLPTYGIFDEARYLAAGNVFEAFRVPERGIPQTVWTAGQLICEDMWHLSAAASLSRQETDLLLCQSASPGRGFGVANGGQLGTAHSYANILSTYAQLGGSYAAYANRVGCEEGMVFWGGSRLVGPDGQTRPGMAGDEEALLWYHLTEQELRAANLASPLRRDERHDVR